MATERPCCQTGPSWLRQHANDRSVLAPLTGQDRRALAAFLHLLELYSVADDDGRGATLNAMAYTILAMQSSTRHLAKAMIPHVLDWNDEDRIWTMIAAS